METKGQPKSLNNKIFSHGRKHQENFVKVLIYRYHANKSSLLCDKSSLLCDQSSLLCDKLSLLCDKSSLLGYKSSLLGDKSSLLGDKSSLLGDKSSLLGDKSSLLCGENLVVKVDIVLVSFYLSVGGCCMWICI